MLPAPAALSIAPPGRRDLAKVIAGVGPSTTAGGEQLGEGAQVSLSSWLLPASLLGGESSPRERSSTKGEWHYCRPGDGGGGQGDMNAGGCRGGRAEGW